MHRPEATAQKVSGIGCNSDMAYMRMRGHVMSSSYLGFYYTALWHVASFISLATRARLYM